MVPLVNCDFTLLPVQFAVDPAVDDTSVQSYNRQTSLSQQADLLANYMDIERVAVAQNSSGPDLLDHGEMRLRTGSWGGRAGEGRQMDSQAARTDSQTARTDSQVDERTDTQSQTNKKKAKNTQRLGIRGLGRVMSKKLKPGAKQKELIDVELRQRRKASVGSATQSTRLSCLTDDMLLDHTKVNTRLYVVLMDFTAMSNIHLFVCSSVVDVTQC